MVFSTDSDLSYIYLQYKSEKVHGLFGLGWKNQGCTVRENTELTIIKLSIFDKSITATRVKVILSFLNSLIHSVIRGTSHYLEALAAVFYCKTRRHLGLKERPSERQPNRRF